MTFYKWCLAAAVSIIIALFLYPYLTAKAAVVVGSAQLVTPVHVPSVPERIQYWCTFYHYACSTPLKIAWCESRFSPTAHNPLSTAKGVYQFLDGTWGYYAKLHWGEVGNVLTGEDNIELAIWVMSQYGTDDWLASKWCWK